MNFFRGLIIGLPISLLLWMLLLWPLHAQEYPASFSLQEWNVIAQSLGTQPYALSDYVISPTFAGSNYPFGAVP